MRPFSLVAPAPPPANAVARSRRALEGQKRQLYGRPYMREPSRHEGSHLPNYAALGKMRAKHRLQMVDNIYLHSALSETGMAAYHARAGYFEFAVLDRGVGVLRSLQNNSEYSCLSDHGDALQLALTDGCSRFGSNSSHGHGFRPLFIGLSNLNGALRFRSGDHALTIDGRNPQTIPWTKIAKANISGFFASVSCRTHFDG